MPDDQRAGVRVFMAALVVVGVLASACGEAERDCELDRCEKSFEAGTQERLDCYREFA